METSLLAMLNTPEIVLILVLALILFGAKKLPELAKGLGHGIKEFRKASREISDELNTAMYEPPARKTPKSPDPSPPTSPEETVAQGSEPAEPLTGERPSEAPSDDEAPPVAKS